MEIPPAIPPPLLAVRPQPIAIARSSDLLLPSYFTDRRLTPAVTEVVDHAHQTDMDEWANHYQPELRDMYETCVDPMLRVEWSQFVRAMYESTLETYDSKKFKWVRPLL